MWRSRPRLRCHPRRAVVTIVMASLLATACGSGAGPTQRQASSAASAIDARTARALLQVATVFNQNYAANRDGAVYDRWDTSSRAVISRRDYIKRHAVCPTAPGAAVVESASPTSGGYWRVRYSISGSQLVDFWHYVRHRWVFDLPRSNPDAVKLYRLSFPAYARAVGCSAQ